MHVSWGQLAAGSLYPSPLASHLKESILVFLSRPPWTAWQAWKKRWSRWVPGFLVPKPWPGSLPLTWNLAGGANPCTCPLLRTIFLSPPPIPATVPRAAVAGAAFLASWHHSSVPIPVTVPSMLLPTPWSSLSASEILIPRLPLWNDFLSLWE